MPHGILTHAARFSNDPRQSPPLLPPRALTRRRTPPRSLARDDARLPRARATTPQVRNELLYLRAIAAQLQLVGDGAPPPPNGGGAAAKRAAAPPPDATAAGQKTWAAPNTRRRREQEAARAKRIEPFHARAAASARLAAEGAGEPRYVVQNLERSLPFDAKSSLGWIEVRPCHGSI